MTGWNATSTASRPVGSIVSRLDPLVSAIRRWMEDRVPWYDRAQELQKIERTEAIRRRSIDARIRNEAIRAQHRFGR